MGYADQADPPKSKEQIEIEALAKNIIVIAKKLEKTNTRIRSKDPLHLMAIAAEEMAKWILKGSK